MKRVKKQIVAAILGLCLLVTGVWIVPTQAEASSGDGWVGAWSTSPVEFNLKNESRPITTKEMIAGYE